MSKNCISLCTLKMVVIINYVLYICQVYSIPCISTEIGGLGVGNIGFLNSFVYLLF